MKSPAILCLLLFLLFAFLFARTAREKSPTWDEIPYFGLGAHLLKTGRWDVAASCSHPPLAYYLHSIPCLFFALEQENWHPPAGRQQDVVYLRSADPGRGNRLLLSPTYDGEFLFWLCRLMGLGFAALLAFALYRWGTALYGPAGVFFIFLLFSLSPNLLAHGPLINTDFAFAATFFFSIYTFRRLLLAPSHKALVSAGVALGLALMSKLSALVLLAAMPLAALWFARFASFDQRKIITAYLPRPLPLLLALGAILTIVVAIGAAVLLAGYRFQITPYYLTLRSQLWDISTGHSAYLMGEHSIGGWWYYYPLALLIKTPLAALLLLGAACWRWWKDSILRLEAGFALLPPLLLVLVFVLSGSKNIGLRYLLPIYPFIFLVAGAIAHWTFSLQANKAAKILLALTALWYTYSTLSIHPHHLAYFNELVGGPKNGYRYLVDSNLDWGQDLKGLKRYMDERGIGRIKLSYFGTVDPALYNLDYDWLPSYILPRTSTEAVQLPTDGLIAISATNLVGVYMDQYGYGKDLFDWLQGLDPIDHIGYSIFIYEAGPPP